MTKNNFNSNQAWFYADSTKVGLLDADGGFLCYPTKKKNNQYGFSVRCEFSQAVACKDALEPIANQYKVPLMIKSSKIKRIKLKYRCLKLKTKGLLNKRNIKPKVNFRGKKKIKTKCAVAINFNSAAGKAWLKVLAKNLPLVPSKRKDYRISCIVHRYALNGVNSISQLNQQKYQGIDKQKVATVAMLWLISYMRNPAKRLKWVMKKLPYLKASKQERSLGKDLANALYAPIKVEVTNLKNGLYQGQIAIPKRWFIGYWIGDGSLMIGLANKRNPEPSFTLTEKTETSAILYGIQHRFFKYSNRATKAKALFGDFSSSKRSAVRYRLQGWNNCLQYVLPLLDHVMLPKTRQKQFNTFKRVLFMALAGQHLLRPGFVRMVNLFWNMNAHRTRRHIDISTAIAEGLQSFDEKEQKRARKEFTHLHSSLRKVHTSLAKEHDLRRRRELRARSKEGP